MNFAKFQESEELRKADQRAKHAAKRAEQKKLPNPPINENKKAHDKQYREDNKLYIQARQKEYQLDNAEKIAAKKKLFNETHKDQIKATLKAYRLKHRDNEFCAFYFRVRTYIPPSQPPCRPFNKYWAVLQEFRSKCSPCDSEYC